MTKTKRIAVSGASGMVGTALVNELREFRHTVHELVRSRKAAGERDNVYWNVDEGVVDAAALEGHDAVVHFAGESLFQVWTKAAKEEMWTSRVRGTRLLAETLAGLDDPPAVFICASGISYYGSQAPTKHLGEDAPERPLPRVELDQGVERNERRDAGISHRHEGGTGQWPDGDGGQGGN